MKLTVMCKLLILYSDDYNRVKLKEIPTIEGSDYINASFLDVSCLLRVYVSYYDNNR